MKLKNLFYLLLALPIMFVACEEEPDTKPTPQAPKLTLTSSSEIFIQAEGGEGSITYTLENPVEGTELTAVADVDWIKNITVAEAITFTVAQNEKAALRSGVVTVAYGDAKFTVSVKQLAATLPDPVLDLTSAREMEFECEGGTGKITYTLENPIEGVELIVTPSAEATWISDISTETNGEISFAVALNPGDAREGTISVAYSTQGFEVKISQKRNDIPTVIVESRTEVTIDAEGVTAKEIKFSLLNADETLNVEAKTDVEWISNLTVNAEESVVTYDVAKNEDLKREGKITLTYGKSTAVVSVTQKGIPVFEVTNIAAKPHESVATAWDLILFEHDENKGDMPTHIIINLEELNPFRIPDGTYTVANGGILTNDGTSSSFSVYRKDNTTDQADITECSLAVTNDREAETTKLFGYFVAGGQKIAIDWSGNIPGITYKDLGPEGITNWDSFTMRAAYDDAKLITAKFGGLTFELYLRKLGSNKTENIVTGTFPVKTWVLNTTEDFCEGENGGSNVNGVSLKNSGQVVIEAAGDEYKVTFDITDANNNNWKGTHVGPLK